MGVTTRTLGPASLAFPLVGAELLGGRLYLVSRNLTPPQLAVYDLGADRVTSTTTIPSGAGAWGMTTSGDRLVYLGVFGARRKPNLFRFDRSTGALTAVAVLDVEYVWDLAAAPDGIVYGVTAPDLVIAYDPARNRTDQLGIIDPGSDRLRSVATGADRFYVGGNRHGRARILEVERATRTARDIAPPALGDHQTVYALHATSHHLLAGTRGPGAVNPAVAAIERANPGVARVVELPGESVVDTVTAAPNAVWCTARPSGALYRLDLGNGALTQVAVPVPNSETRGIFLHGNAIVGASATGHVWRTDRTTGATTVIDLLDAGLSGRPELAQSLAAGHGNVYVGGNFGFSVRDVATGLARRFLVPGEPKDLGVADAGVYLGIYPTAQLWVYEPATGAPRMVAQLPVEQNRPVAVHVDENDLVLVGTAADRLGGGGFHVYSPRSRRLASLINPLGPGQNVASIASGDGLAYLGGSGIDPSIAAYSPRTRQQRWLLANPLPGGNSITGLAVLGARLYALTATGWLAVIDLDTRAVLHRRRLRQGGGRLATAGGVVYGVGPNSLFAIDPVSFGVDVVLTDLRSQIWGWPMLAADADGDLYVIKGHNVVQVQRT
jgi:hypothetical protein